MAAINNFRGTITKNYKVLNHAPLNIKSENGTPLFYLEVQFGDRIERSIVYGNKETYSNGTMSYNDAHFFTEVSQNEMPSVNLIDSPFGILTKITYATRHNNPLLFSRKEEYKFL
jgi:hypothetical protein